MEDRIKRFLQDLSLTEISVLALTAGTISVQLMEYSTQFQFLASSILVLAEAATIYKVQEMTDISSYNIAIPVLIVSSYNLISQILAAIFFVGIILLPILILKDTKLFGAGLLAHLADVLSTIMALGDFTEANPITRMLIIRLGDIQGLIISKILFILLPMIWTSRSLGKTDRVIFYNFVFGIGISMAFRNFIIIL